jgi:hypothetical protein
MGRMVPFAVLAVVAGAAGAQAASGGPPTAAPGMSPVVAVPVAAAANARARIRARLRIAAIPAAAGPLVLSAPTAGALPQPLPMCRPGRRSAAKPASASEALKSAFGILRSEPDADDALPARVLEALKERGLAPVDPRSARLLRADRRARAWVVPVPDVGAASSYACPPGYSRAALPAPREGLAVVAVNGAPAGGGGSLRDLRRGLAPATVDPCAGAGRKMLGVSGIVPDGVDAVFATAADGTATRADVHDNGYSFVLALPRRPDSRYLVWTGADGTPHVQPLPIVLAARGRGGACPPVELRPHVTPEPLGPGCGPTALGGLSPAWPAIVTGSRALPPIISRPGRTRGETTSARPVPGRPSAPLAVAPMPALTRCLGGFAAPAILRLRPPLPASKFTPRPRTRPAPPRPARSRAAKPRPRTGP